MGDAIAAPPPLPPSGPASFSYLAVFSNCPLVAAVLAFAIAQSIKVFTTWYKENRWDAKQLIGSGGMPSSHSATVTALSVVVGLQEGFTSSLFATAAIFASVVLSDPHKRATIYDPYGEEGPKVYANGGGSSSMNGPATTVSILGALKMCLLSCEA